MEVYWLILPQCRTRMFSEGELYISRIRFNGSSPFCFRPRTKSSTESWARWDWKNRKVAAGLEKKGRRTTCPFVNTAPVLFLSSVPPRLSSLARIVNYSSPSVHLLPAASTLPLARSFVLYSESTFSQYRNRSRIGAWRCAIRRAEREIVLS